MKLWEAVSSLLSGEIAINTTVAKDVEVTIDPVLEEIGGKRAITTGETSVYGGVEVVLNRESNVVWDIAPDHLMTSDGIPLDKTTLYQEKPWWQLW